MDPSLIAQQPPPGFEVQFQQFMFYAGPIAQLLFWLVVGIAAIWAAVTFKRLTDFMTGDVKADGGKDVAAKSSKDKKVAVEEFVE